MSSRSTCWSTTFGPSRRRPPSRRRCRAWYPGCVGRSRRPARTAVWKVLADALLALGRPQEALDRLEVHVGEHPLRERPWGQLMLALYRRGRQADALHAFRRVRRILAEELGVEPMPELRQLAERILHHDPDLATPDGPVHRRAGRHNLPVPLTSWVGRKRELDEVVSL